MNEQSATSEFDQLLQRNRGRLTAIAHSYADGDADDLLQEILLQIWKSLHAFQQQSSVDTWCYRVALNTAISWSRRRQARRKHLPAQHGTDLNQVSAAEPGRQESDNQMRLLQQFVRTLSDVDRAIILMYLEEISSDEIAAATGLTAGAVRVRIHRIKQRLSDWEAGAT